MRFFFSTFLEWEVWSTYTMDWSAASSLCVDAQSIFIILSKELTVMKREKENHEKPTGLTSSFVPSALNIDKN